MRTGTGDATGGRFMHQSLEDKHHAAFLGGVVLITVDHSQERCQICSARIVSGEVSMHRPLLVIIVTLASGSAIAQDKRESPPPKTCMFANMNFTQGVEFCVSVRLKISCGTDGLWHSKEFVDPAAKTLSECEGAVPIPAAK
jgi:hypothetical protein